MFAARSNGSVVEGYVLDVSSGSGCVVPRDVACADRLEVAPSCYITHLKVQDCTYADSLWYYNDAVSVLRTVMRGDYSSLRVNPVSF